MTLLNTLLDTCATLTKKVANLKQDKIAQALEITKLKQRVMKLEKKRRTKHSGLKRLRKVESQAKVYNLDLQHSEKVLSMQDTNEAEPAEVKEMLKVVTAAKLMTEDNTVIRYQALKRKPVTAAQARKNMMIYLKNMAGFKMDFSKKAAKKQRIDEEAKKLKSHLQIVPDDDDDDDVYTEATPLASKLHYFIEDFNKEDLEALWKLVKERYKFTKLKNFSDDYLLNNFKIVFEKPNVEANVWRDQKGRYGLAKVKSWKMFESYEVHIITLTTTQMILLVEKKYLLTHFTLEQILNNVRLEVEEESKMSLELLRNKDLLKSKDPQCASLSEKVVELEQDKHTQALKFLELKKRVKKLEKKKRSKRMHPNRGKIEATDADEDITLVDMEKDEEMAQKLHDEEVLKAAAMDKQEKDDMERAQVLQKQYVDKEENIYWNTIVEQIQERHLDNIKKYQSLKTKPVSIAQARKNMIIYLKNMTGKRIRLKRDKSEQKRTKPDKNRKRDEARKSQEQSQWIEQEKPKKTQKEWPIFEREYKKVQTLFKPDKDVEEPKKKRVTDETLLQESFKKLKTVEVSGSESTQEIPSNDSKKCPKKMFRTCIPTASENFPLPVEVPTARRKFPLLNKYKTAQELWAAILKTFGGNEATKKTKKNLLKQQYGNFKAEGSKTLEQTFNRLQVIVSRLEFMNIEIKQDDLNQKFLTSLAPEWLMHTIVWKNISDLDTMSLDDLYNHLKNMALLSMRADRFWKKTGKKISIKGTDMDGFDKSKVECFNYHKMGQFARECRAPRSQDRGRRDNYRQGSKVKEQDPKALMEIDGVGWDWSYMANDEENHALIADEEAPIKFALMAKTSAKSETGLPEFEDDTVTDYSRPPPAIKSTSDDVQNRNTSVTKTEPSPSTTSPKPFIKFVKASDSLTKSKTDKVKTDKKPAVNSQNNIDDKGYWDSDCSRHMTGNISYLSDYEPFDGGYVSFGQGGCKITGKKTIKTGKLEFENAYFVKDLKYNLFSVLQICDSKNSVLFTDSECIVFGRNFKLLDDTNVLLRTPRRHNMYSIDLNNIVPHKDLTCLVAKASADEWKFDAKGDEGYFIGYSMSIKAFRVFNKRTKRVEENLRVDFVENKAIEKGAGPNWLFDIDSLTKSMNYVPVVDVGTNSTNLSGTQDASSQEVKKCVSSLRYIALPNWVHDALLESSSMETPIPTISLPVPIAYFTDSQEPSSDTRLISKRVANQVETPSMDNILTLINRFEDILRVTTNSDESNGVEADVRNIETTITASPTPTLRIHKDHPKIQIIEPKKIYDALQDPSWVEAMKEELLQFKIQKTLFIRRQRGDFILVQVYVDDIIFESSNPQLCREFKALMHEKFQISAMGELNFFLGLQVLQKEDGIFLSQDKYVGDILKKFGYSDVNSANTPINKENPWGKDGTRKDGEGSGTPTKPQHTPSLKAQQTSPTTHSSPLLPPVTTATIPPVIPSEPLPTVVPPDTPHLRQYTRRARIAQSLALLPVADELASPLRDVSQGEACPTVSSLEAKQDRANIAKTSTLPHDLQMQQTKLVSKFEAQEVEITRLKARIKLLEDREGGVAEQFGDDAPIKGRRLDEGEEAAKKEAKDFKGMALEEIKEIFDPVWKQIHDFILIGSKEEAERFKRKGIRFEQESVKKLKTSEEVKATEEVPEEKVKEMIQLIPVEEIIRLGGSSAIYQFFVDMLKHLDREDLNQLWRLVKETLSIRPPTSDKEMEISVELKRLYEPDAEDQLWTYTQNMMHAPIEWKLCDSCGVHHVIFKDKEIFMLEEKDYPLRKGLAIVMISYKLQVENYSQMASDLILKIYKIANRPRQEDD
nr:putative ribonuclease H-like domain-containing protein [Tanacetum cinerariifolium]